MRAWKCKQVIDFDKSTTTIEEERNKTLQQQTTDKYHHFQVVTLMCSLNMINTFSRNKFSMSGKKNHSKYPPTYIFTFKTLVLFKRKEIQNYQGSNTFRSFGSKCLMNMNMNAIFTLSYMFRIETIFEGPGATPLCANHYIMQWLIPKIITKGCCFLLPSPYHTECFAIKQQEST